MPSRHTRLLVLGGGPAGYTAAIYAARAGMKPLVLTGIQPGGQLTITSDVENYPGFADPIAGPYLMDQMQAQVNNMGGEILYETILKVDLSRRPFVLESDSETFYTADALVIATGAKARWLGVAGEKELSGYGVSACATCDGFFYRGKEVAVIGGGNTAVEEALYLAALASKVTLIHRRQSLRAERVLQERLISHPKISIIWNSVVDSIHSHAHEGHPSVRSIMLRDVESGFHKELIVQGVFVAIGHDPATALFRSQIRVDDDGYIVTVPDSTRTNIPGVFAAGDVRDKFFRQAVTAAASGCMAALEADKWLSHAGASM